VRQCAPPPAQQPIQVGFEFVDHPQSPSASSRILAPASILPLCLHMQVPSEPDAAAHFDRVVAREVPGRRGLQAWSALLRAHATLLRQLETDLESKTGLALADYDVLAQLAGAGGSLRMTELPDQALISRSGMTRRVARLVHEGLVRRAHADADARGV